MNTIGRISWFAALLMAVHAALNHEPAWATMFLAFACLLSLESSPAREAGAHQGGEDGR